MAQLVNYAAQADSAPFDIDPVIARLASLQGANGKPLLRQVRGAADLAEIEEIQSFAPPEAFVVLMIERGQPRPGTARQPVIAAFSVVIAARNYSSQLGKAAADDIRPLLNATRGALVGWVPNQGGVAARGARGCVWQQGGLVDYSAGTLLWSEVYLAQHFIGGNAQ